MKNVLIVDDENSFLLSLTDMLKDNKDNFSILTASNGKEALNVINKNEVDLVVTDLKMPEMDGFDLLAQLSHSKPDVPVIVMTAYGTPEMENRLMDMGAFQYIEKPIDFNTLLHKINDGLETGSKGHVAGISLPSFLQLLELDKKTCTLTIKVKNNHGKMYFKQGELVDATTGDLTGQEAAFEIIGWDNTEIEIQNSCRRQKRTITAPLGFILIESVRQKDEGQMAKEEAGKDQENPESPGTKEIPGVNVDELDFGSKPQEVDPTALAAEKGIKGKPTEETGSSSLVQAIKAISSMQKMLIIAKDGTVLAQENVDNKNFGAFVACVTGSAIKLKNILGFNGPQFVDINKTTGEKILILIGPEVIVGIELSADATPSQIADTLKDEVAKAKGK